MDPGCWHGFCIRAQQTPTPRCAPPADVGAPGEKNMARSLVVKHEEKVGTSSLLNAFLLIALAWMVGGAVLASTGESSGPAPLVGGQ